MSLLPRARPPSAHRLLPESLTTVSMMVIGVIVAAVLSGPFAFPWTRPQDGILDSLGLPTGTPESGSTVVLVFQPLDCADSRGPLADLELAQGSQMVGVMIGSTDLKQDVVDQLLAASGIDFPVVRSEANRIVETLRTLGHTETPVLMLFDAAARLRLVSPLSSFSPDSWNLPISPTPDEST